VTILEALDFECPHCREMNKRLEEAKTKTRVPVRIVRKMLPLPMHPGAVPAAIAYCCADMQGKGEEMAKLLFEAPVTELNAKGCQRMAIKAGCDLDRFLADVPKAIERVQGEMKELRAAKINSLPTMFIGHDRHVGVGLSVDELVAEIEKHAP
jgi:predicted DsbA family dithiol-disulfide isomerase